MEVLFTQASTFAGSMVVICSDLTLCTFLLVKSSLKAIFECLLQSWVVVDCFPWQEPPQLRLPRSQSPTAPGEPNPLFWLPEATPLRLLGSRPPWLAQGNLLWPGAIYWGPGQLTGARGNLLEPRAIYWGPGQFTGARGNLLGRRAIEWGPEQLIGAQGNFLEPRAIYWGPGQFVGGGLHLVDLQESYLLRLDSPCCQIQGCFVA